VPLRALRTTAALGLIMNLLTLGATPAPDRIASAGPEPTPETARDFYNSGTRKLAQRKYREAEALLETALAKQVEAVQPGALYNLGHVRFAQGLDELQKGPQRGARGARQFRSRAWCSGNTGGPMSAGVGRGEAMVAAYMRGVAAGGS